MYEGLQAGDRVRIAAGGERGERCPDCLGANGEHGMVHTRYGNGGGGNKPCPRDTTD